MAHDKLESYVSPEDEYIIPVTYKINDDDEAIAAQDCVHIGEVEISPEDFSSQKETKNP